WANPAVSLAIRDIPDKDARAVAVGISIPLPLFQRNQTALAAANASAQKASANQDNTTRRLHMELIKAHTLLVAADREVRTLRSQVLSRSAEAAEAVREGFRYGKFRYSDVLEAFQNQVEIKARHLDALLELNRSAITLDRLLGKPSLSEFSPKKLSASDHRSTP
ncbi:MAG: TolC family protein, partial [Desulfobulbaceae bacterium]|nr:TolC family protein [Desulfobulbaceae bacterium]